MLVTARTPPHSVVSRPDTPRTLAHVLGASGWVDELYPNEVERHGIDGVAHLAAPDSGSAHITNVALEAAGVPVFDIDADNADNADRREWDADRMEAEISDFINRRVIPRAEARLARERT